MSRKPTPPPESRFVEDGGVFALIWSAPFIVLYLVFGKWWFLLFTFPLVLYAVHLIYGVLLLFAGWLRWHETPVRGILILSDSPNWGTYIEENWLPRLSEKVVVLNWSEWRKWRASLPVRIFRYFGEGGDNFNFNPALILFQGLRYPLVYRYYYAFLDAKHDNVEALQRLELLMFEQLEPSP
jgi:hypothetical protein